MTRIVGRPAAAADIEEAFRWYEDRREGLGDEFLAAVNLALDDITLHPAMYRVMYRPVQGREKSCSPGKRRIEFVQVNSPKKRR